MVTRLTFVCVVLLSFVACSKETKTPPPAVAISKDSALSAASTDSTLAAGSTDSALGSAASTDSTLVPGSTDSTLASGASTDSNLAAGSTDSALAGPKTSEELLRRWADTCKNAKVIYEESKLSVRVEGPRPANPTDVSVKAAFKRPDVVRAEITGRQNLTIHYAGGEGIVYNRDVNQYFKSQQPLAAFSRVFQQLFSLSSILSDDPYALITRQVVKIDDLKTSQFEGKEVYEVGLNAERSVRVTVFFDKEKFYLLGATAQVPVPDGTGTIQVVETVGRMLIDELPKDADGKEIDAFSFTLPDGATELSTASPPAGPPSPPSTDSGVKP